MKERSQLSSEVQNIIEIIENQDFSVSLYEEDDVTCGAEIEAWTDGGVDMIHFVDLRGKDIDDTKAWKDEIASIASDFDIDEEIDIHREGKEYCAAFTCRQSVEDFEAWQERLRLLAQAVIYPEMRDEA